MTPDQRATLGRTATIFAAILLLSGGLCGAGFVVQQFDTKSQLAGVLIVAGICEIVLMIVSILGLISVGIAAIVQSLRPSVNSNEDDA